MTRVLGTAFFLSLVVVSALVAVAPASGSPSNVAITSVNTSVDQPAPGEPVTVTMEVRNPESSAGEIRITNAQIKGGGTGTAGYIQSVNDVGALAPGESLDISLTTTFDDPGAKSLAAEVRILKPGGALSSAHSPFFVNVVEPTDVVSSFRSPEEIDPVAGEETEINISISNGGSESLSNVRVSLEGDPRVAIPDRVSPSLEAGARTSHTFRVTFPEAGDRTLTAVVTYPATSHTTRTVTRQITTDVDESNVDTGLTARTASVNGSSVIEATLTEYGNVELRDGEVRAVVDGETVTRSLVPDVPSQESHTVTLDGSEIPAGDVSIVAVYTAVGEVRSVETAVDYAPQQTAEIALSSVEATRRGSSLTLSGDAANVGSGDARSVLVSVGETPGVTPTAPNREFFIGQIPESEFDTFELTAAVTPEVGTVPVRVQYSVEGEQYSQTVAVDVSDVSTPPVRDGVEGDPDRSGGLVSTLPVVAIAVVLAVLGSIAVIYRWRKR